MGMVPWFEDPGLSVLEWYMGMVHGNGTWEWYMGMVPWFEGPGLSVLEWYMGMVHGNGALVLRALV